MVAAREAWFVLRVMRRAGLVDRWVWRRCEKDVSEREAGMAAAAVGPRRKESARCRRKVAVRGDLVGRCVMSVFWRMGCVRWGRREVVRAASWVVLDRTGWLRWGTTYHGVAVGDVADERFQGVLE